MFRDLDVANNGAITMGEFRHLLARHNLDVGISDAQLRVLMQKFPQADAVVQRQSSEPAIDWRGFVESLLDIQTLSPEEVKNFLSFIRGLKDTAADGVGGMRTVPAVRPFVNRVSSWTEASADPTNYLRAMNAGAPTTRPATTPQSAPVSRSSSVVASVPCSTRPATPPTAPTRIAGPLGGSPAPSRPATATAGKSVTFLRECEVPSLPADKQTFKPATAYAVKDEGSVVDVVTVLSKDVNGGRLLDKIAKTFDRKRFDLYRALSLYDTTRKKVLSVQSFVAALASAGLKLDRAESGAFRTALVSAAAENRAAAATEQEVNVDYSRFFDEIFGGYAQTVI
jgi:hypothetical protein